MPLKKSASKKAREENIREMITAGQPPEAGAVLVRSSGRAAARKGKT